MLRIKGFISLKKYVNNASGVISEIGELSTYARTFSKDIKDYSEIFAPEIIFNCFISKNIDQNEDLTPQMSSHIISISNYVFNYVKNYVGNLTPLELANNLLYNFNSQITNLVVGQLVSGSAIKLPKFISWSVNGQPDNFIKIWFSEDALTKEYDEYSITVIPPILDLNDFFREINFVDDALSERTIDKAFDLIQDAKLRNPETSVRSLTFEYTNSLTNTNKRKVTWYCLIYGQSGDNDDALREAILNHAYLNSSFSELEWKQIIPDLFNRTEFYLFPDWNSYAIPNKVTQAGIYSPIVTLKDKINQIKSYFNFNSLIYDPHIENNLQTFNHPYRSISISSFGGLFNKESKFKITDNFPDYINVGTNNSDFYRMSDVTSEWSNILNTVLSLCENYNNTQTLPSGYRKINKNNKEFISFVYENIYYLVNIKPVI